MNAQFLYLKCQQLGSMDGKIYQGFRGGMIFFRNAGLFLSRFLLFWVDMINNLEEIYLDCSRKVDSKQKPAN